MLGCSFCLTTCPFHRDIFMYNTADDPILGLDVQRRRNDPYILILTGRAESFKSPIWPDQDACYAELM